MKKQSSNQLHRRIATLDRGHPQGSPEWHLARLTMYTASIIAGIIGVNPYENEAKIWARKLGLKEEVGRGASGNWMTRRGTYFEHIAAALYAKERGVNIRHYNLCVHKDVDWLGASPDGVTDDEILVEIKVPATRKIIPKEIPVHIMPQLQVNMEVLDLERAHLVQYAPLTSHDGYLCITETSRDREWWSRWFPFIKLSHQDFMERIRSLPAEDLASLIDSYRKAPPAMVKSIYRAPSMRLDLLWGRSVEEGEEEGGITNKT